MASSGLDERNAEGAGEAVEQFGRPFDAGRTAGECSGGRERPGKQSAQLGAAMDGEIGRNFWCPCTDDDRVLCRRRPRSRGARSDRVRGGRARDAGLECGAKCNREGGVSGHLVRLRSDHSCRSPPSERIEDRRQGLSVLRECVVDAAPGLVSRDPRHDAGRLKVTEARGQYARRYPRQPFEQVFEPAGPHAQIAKDEQRPPFAEQAARLREATELCVILAHHSIMRSRHRRSKRAHLNRWHGLVYQSVELVNERSCVLVSWPASVAWCRPLVR